MRPTLRMLSGGSDPLDTKHGQYVLPDQIFIPPDYLNLRPHPTSTSTSPSIPAPCQTPTSHPHPILIPISIPIPIPTPKISLTIPSSSSTNQIPRQLGQHRLAAPKGNHQLRTEREPSTTLSRNSARSRVQQLAPVSDTGALLGAADAVFLCVDELGG